MRFSLCEEHHGQDAWQSHSPDELGGYCVVAVAGESDESAYCRMVSGWFIPDNALLAALDGETP